MSDLCPKCSAPLIGRSCYVCGWPDVSAVPTDDKDRGSRWDDDLVPDEPGSQATRSWDHGEVDPWADEGQPPVVPDAVRKDPRTSGRESVRVAQRLLGAVVHVVSGDTVSGYVVSVSEPTLENVSLLAHNASQQALTGCLMTPFKAIGIMLGLLFAPLRFLLGAAVRPGLGAHGPDSVQVQARRFRIEDSGTGRTIECYLRGELVGGDIYLGEEVEATGRFQRSTGIFEVARLQSLKTGAVTTGSVDSRVRFGGL